MTSLGQHLIDNVRRIAADNPDFIYIPTRDEENGRFQACQYVRNGCGDCLLGRALFDAGLISPDLELTGHNYVPFQALVDALQLDLDTDEVHWLRRVQQHQDSFRPWKNCVAWTDAPEAPVVGELIFGKAA